MVIARIVSHEGFLYQVIRKLNTSYIINKDGSLKKTLLDIWKEQFNADAVLNDASGFLICQKIEDIDFEMIKQ